MTEDERNAMFDECVKYDDYLRANGRSAGGEALQPPQTALTLYWRNGKVATTDDPYMETKERLGGIGVLEARDLNYAIQLLSQHPVLKYGALLRHDQIVDMNEMIRESEQRRRKDTAR